MLEAPCCMLVVWVLAMELPCPPERVVMPLAFVPALLVGVPVAVVMPAPVLLVMGPLMALPVGVPTHHNDLFKTARLDSSAATYWPG